MGNYMLTYSLVVIPSKCAAFRENTFTELISLNPHNKLVCPAILVIIIIIFSQSLSE